MTPNTGTTLSSFKDLNLPQSLSKALEALNFSTPTPIQAQAIPMGINGQDIVGLAQTGTGKTAAFCLPIALKLIAHPAKSALILVPTRELAGQIELFWRALTKFTPNLNCALLMGGVSMQPQIQALRRHPRVIIATPGRLVDHLNRRNIKLAHFDTLVLDEADRMLDMGFAPQLREILKYVPTQRQTLFFSATWSPEMEKLSSQYSKTSTRVTAGTVNKAAAKVEQSGLETTVRDKNDTLLDEINKSKGSVIVFARTQSRTDRLGRWLTGYGLHVERIHGGRTQGQRKNALEAFRSGKTRILLATDLAARGLDVPHVALVINYDLPQVAEDYIHRIGRTARAGASGLALSLLTPEDRAQWRVILALLKKSGSGMPEMSKSTVIAPQRAELPRSAPQKYGQNHGNSQSNGQDQSQRRHNHAPHSGPNRRERRDEVRRVAPVAAVAAVVSTGRPAVKPLDAR